MKCSAIPGTYFVTTATQDRRRIFQVERNPHLFLETLAHYRENYLLHAYVVMPDHIHLLLTPGGVTLERCMQLIKGGFSHRYASKLPVWQKGFTDHRIRDAGDLTQNIRYIHEKQIAANLAPTIATYRYSSAHPERLNLDEVKADLSG